MLRHALPLFAALLSLAATPAAASASAEPSYAGWAAIEARVATIGFRLTTANAAWCPARQPQFGWIWGDPRLYEAGRRSEALAAYGASDRDAPFVAAIANASPAATAGMRVGMAVLGIEGRPVPEGEGSHPFARITALETYLGGLPAETPVAFDVGGGSAIRITPVPGCIGDFRVEPSAKAGAVADGRMILVNYGLAQFAADDDELAAAIAHELAHNVLRHRARLDAAGVDRGLGKQFGRNARLFRQTEVEADRLSVWLLAGAGYDPAAAARFWTRFGQRKGRPFVQAGTHPRWRDRVASLEAEAAAIAAARGAGRPLHPPLIDNPPPLE
jgi:hypothetical protein